MAGPARRLARRRCCAAARPDPALVPGDPEKSTLIKAVQHADGFPRMPRGRAKLPAADIDARGRVDPRRRGLAGVGRDDAGAGRLARAGDHAGAARVLVVPADRQAARRRRCATPRGRGPTSIASSSRGSRREGLKPVARRRQADAAAPRDARPDRPAADAGRGRRVPRRRLARRVRQGRGSPAGLAALRRSVGPRCGSTSRATARTTIAASIRWAAASIPIPTRTCIATG